jgi:raffinose/stachyose/melibiose transport system permease protein
MAWQKEVVDRKCGGTLTFTDNNGARNGQQGGQVAIINASNSRSTGNTREGLILPYVALFLPLAIWIMRGTFLTMPKELGQAARIDGASELRVFSRIYLSMARGGLATVVLLTFIQVWNEVLLASTLAIHPEIANINTGLRMLQDEGQAFAFGALSAVILLTMLPTLAVFMLLQRHYVRGVSEGAFAGF